LPSWEWGIVGLENLMIESLFTLYCEDCEVSGQPSRLWVRAEIEVTSARGLETQHYLECMNCGFRFKSCMEDHMEAVDEEEWRRFVDEDGAGRSDLGSPIG
jgi:hypothetical protein